MAYTDAGQSECWALPMEVPGARVGGEQWEPCRQAPATRHLHRRPQGQSWAQSSSGGQCKAFRSEEVTEKWAGASGDHGTAGRTGHAAKDRQKSTPSGGAEGFPRCYVDRTILTKEKEQPHGLRARW